MSAMQAAKLSFTKKNYAQAENIYSGLKTNLVINHYSL